MNQALKNNLSLIISPEVASDLLWFLKCWTSAYLFIKEKDDTNLPRIFKSAFSESSACGKQIAGLILDVVETNLMFLSAEQAVADDAVRLLLKFVHSDTRYDLRFIFDSFSSF